MAKIHQQMKHKKREKKNSSVNRKKISFYKYLHVKA